MGAKTEKAEFQPGDIVRFHENGRRHGRVVFVGWKWVHVECIGRDPRTKRVRRFLRDEIEPEGGAS
ncbi:MAG: hypothetical protein QGF68_14695 [Nitrospinota bacterium]|nr:hypothetical protein [Nitrospinota bacterium]